MTTEPAKITESVVEKTALDWFESLGWQTTFGPDISPDGSACERRDYDQVALIGRLQIAIENINPNIPPDAVEEADWKIVRAESPSLIENNRRFHRMLIRAGLAKATVEGEGKSPEEMDTAILQLVSRAVASEEVIDIFAAAGLKTPDISILSDDFLQEVRQFPHRNLAVELLRKLLNDEIKTNSRKNVVQARSFAEMLEKAIRKYQNRAIEAAQVIEELIKLAKEMREAQQRGENLGMTDDEIAFYDALKVNDSAVKVLGDETLKTIAHELVEAVRRSVSIDWTVRENARAQIRVIVKGILRKYGYPPDKQEKATRTVLEQAEVLCKEWATV